MHRNVSCATGFGYAVDGRAPPFDARATDADGLALMDLTNGITEDYYAIM